MKYRNPVFDLRESIMNNQDLQEKALNVGANSDFLLFAAECGHKCTIDDLKAAISDLRAEDGTVLDGTIPLARGINDGTLPLAIGINDGTLPLHLHQVLLNLLHSALNTIAIADNGTWPLNGSDNLVVVKGWSVGNG